MKKAFHKYAENIQKPFNLTFDVEKMSVEIDRKIATRKESNAGIGDKLF